MQRAIITVKGRVQRVGYRDFVAEIADKMGINGYVQNLPDGKNVEIIAEAERKVLEEFLKLLWAKEDSIIKVTKIDVEYQTPKHDHEYFEIIYEDFQKEGFENLKSYMDRRFLRIEDEISEIRTKIGMSH